MGIWLLIALLQPPTSQVKPTAEPRPASLSPVAENLSPDPHPRHRSYYRALSEPVLESVKRRLCANDAKAQKLWLSAAGRHPKLWTRLPWCRPACAWARERGQENACACQRLSFGCGNDPRSHNDCAYEVASIKACLPQTVAKRQAAIAKLEACAKRTSNKYQRMPMVKQLARLKGWSAHRELVDAAFQPMDFAFVDVFGKLSSPDALEAGMRQLHLLAPNAPDLPHASHPTLSLIALWYQYGQAVDLNPCGTMDGGPHCEGDSFNRSGRATLGALGDIVLRATGDCQNGLTLEAWGENQVWRTTNVSCRDSTGAQIALLNGVLESKSAWGRLHLQSWGLPVFYVSPVGFTHAQDRDLTP